MASLEDRVKELERRASSGASALRALAVRVDLLEKRVQKLEAAAAPTGVPQDAAPRWHSDLKFVEESRFTGKTSEQIFDEGYDAGYARGYDAGYARGYDAGLAAGLPGASTPHRA